MKTSIKLIALFTIIFFMNLQIDIEWNKNGQQTGLLNQISKADLQLSFNPVQIIDHGKIKIAIDEKGKHHKLIPHGLHTLHINDKGDHKILPKSFLEFENSEETLKPINPKLLFKN